MRYSIKNKEKLLSAQEQYCNDVLQESKIENLLKLKLEPALIGFLYAKLTTAEEKGILVEYKIDPIEIAGRIKPYEMIELVGVLFDNAIEALLEFPWFYPQTLTLPVSVITYFEKMPKI